MNADAARAVAEEIGGVPVSLDVSDQAAVEQAFADATAQLGQTPRIVVNCAGIGTAGRIVGREGKLSIDAFERTLRINLLGSYIVLSIAAREMQQLEPLNDDGERGIIINTASVAWQDGQIGQAAYAASKGGIASLTLPAARELAQFGIRVTAIAPGLFETAMTAGLPDDIRAAITANIPFPKRLGHADEYAAAVEHMVENPIINGTVLRLDGAVRLPPR
jgi:NAD(P)-dependent dehydrogenase (short-subunit alcohol dehydrogenase family)